LLIAVVNFEPKQIDSLQVYINKRIAFSDSTIVLRKNGDAEASSKLVGTGIGKQYMDTVKLVSKNITEVAKFLFNNRLEQQEKASYNFIASVVVSLLVFFVFLILLFWQTWHHLKQYYEYQRQTNKTLSQLSAGLIKAQQIGQIGSWEKIIETGIEKWSAEQYRIFGVEPDTAIDYKVDFTKAIHPDEQIIVTQIINKAIADRKHFYCEFRIIQPSGEVKHIKLNGEIYLVEGYGLAAGGTMQDITKDRIAESEKEELAKLLTRTNAIANIGWWVADININIIKWSDVTKKLLEISEDYEPEFDSFLNYIADFDKRAVFFASYQNALTNKESFDLIIPFITAKKKKITIRIIGEPSKNKNGQHTKVFGIFQLVQS